MKEVAESIKKMTSSETMTRILDRSVDVSGLEKELLEHWSYDLFSRRPGPAYLENGVLTPTDLDLACFLSALVDRRAVINLPHYEARRQATRREGEHVVSSSNRHGRVMGLSANKEAFSFSIRVEDQNVVQAASETEGDRIGAPRNFMLVDVDGTWHDGWGRIEFMPTAKENDFLNDRKLWTGNRVVFSNFVHPNRWMSFYGQYYLLTKILIERLEQENEFRREEEKRLLKAGIAFPRTGEGAKKEWPKTEKAGDARSIKVTAFECEVDAPFANEFRSVPGSVEAIVENAQVVKDRQFGILPRLRFAVRATELAFFKAGHMERTMPGWIKGASWEMDYVPKGRRTRYNRLVLDQKKVGQIGFALRYRVYEKSERVAAS